MIYNVDAVHAQVMDAPLPEYGALLGYSAELFAVMFIANAPTLSTWFTEVSKRSYITHQDGNTVRPFLSEMRRISP